MNTAKNEQPEQPEVIQTETERIECSFKVEPAYLDFGIYDPEKPLSKQPSIEVKILNCSDSLLVGWLHPKMNWIVINPSTFRCLPDKTSIHTIQISTDAPQNWERHQYAYNNLFLIESNKGIRSVGGGYRLLRENWRKTFASKISLWLISLFILGFILASVYLISITAPLQAKMEREMYYTQGAVTVFAGLTQDFSKKEKEDQQTLASSKPNQTETPETTPTPQVTFTPWKLNDFQAPDLFIQSFFDGINRNDYESSWNMTGRNYQSSCCGATEKDYFAVFKNDWSLLSRVDVLSVTILDDQKNPLEIDSLLRFVYPNGEIITESKKVYLIINNDQNNLLIDQMK
ncbi:MAG: hypothetical protein JEZ06_17710 [Anaerolineaceae bacterium]|nr:hypothetical protein [Anaerolineaceae bacterium]